VCRLRNVQGGQGDVEMKIQCLFLPSLTVLQTQVSFRIPEHEFNLVANPVILRHFQASHIWVSGKINEGFVHFAILEGVQYDNLAPPFEAANMGQPFVRHLIFIAFDNLEAFIAKVFDVYPAIKFLTPPLAPISCSRRKQTKNSQHLAYVYRSWKHSSGQISRLILGHNTALSIPCLIMNKLEHHARHKALENWASTIGVKRVSQRLWAGKWQDLLECKQVIGSKIPKHHNTCGHKFSRVKLHPTAFSEVENNAIVHAEANECYY